MISQVVCARLNSLVTQDVLKELSMCKFMHGYLFISPPRPERQSHVREVLRLILVESFVKVVLGVFERECEI